MPGSFDPREVEVALRELLDQIPSSPFDFSGIPAAKRKKLVQEIRGAIERLASFMHSVDPILQPPTILDPYQPEVLGRLIGETLLSQPRNQLASLPQFYGSGVYAIYYRGSHEAYSLISGSDTPIYAGKADPPDPLAATPIDQGTRLAVRLSEHAKSIRAATNLDIADFDCRFLVVKSGLQKAAEDYLLSFFKPVWNQTLCSGFGKHGDNPSVRSNTRSEWDTLHPGRAWALREGNRDNPKPTAEIIRQIQAHLGSVTVHPRRSQ
jgi:hypothetical protein